MTDPTTRLEAFEPDPAHLHPPVLAPSDVSYVVEDTVIGRMLLARNDSGALVASAVRADRRRRGPRPHPAQRAGLASGAAPAA